MPTNQTPPASARESVADAVYAAVEEAAGECYVRAHK
jgi:hypothetical protein